MSDKVSDKEWVRKLLKDMKEAKEVPSENCIEGKQHEFKVFSHADSREHYMTYSRCEHCNEVIVSKHKRTGMNKILWEDEE